MVSGPVPEGRAPGPGAAGSPGPGFPCSAIQPPQQFVKNHVTLAMDAYRGHES